jgi:DNA repair exonuclease SbcCD ATPase subunit
LRKEVSELKREIRKKNKVKEKHEEAREVIRTVGQKTQEQLKYNIDNIASMALSSIFKEPLSLELEFVQRRNKTECDILLERDGNKFHPLDSFGGGVVDVVSFALRVASWTMQKPKSAPVFILDEPFKNLSSDYQEKASEMLKLMSEKLKLQIIMVSHEEKLIQSADKVIHIEELEIPHNT